MGDSWLWEGGWLQACGVTWSKAAGGRESHLWHITHLDDDGDDVGDDDGDDDDGGVRS